MFHDLAVDVGQPEIAPLKTVGQLFVVDAEAVQRRRLKIVRMHRVRRNVVTEVIGLAEADAAFDGPALHRGR